MTAEENLEDESGKLLEFEIHAYTGQRRGDVSNGTRSCLRVGTDERRGTLGLYAREAV